MKNYGIRGLEKGYANLEELSRNMHYDRLYAYVVLALVLVLAVTYSIRLVTKGRAHFARIDKQGGSAFLSKSLMEMAYWGLQPLAKLLIFFKITPNMLSWSSFTFGLLSGVTLAFGHFGFGGGFAMMAGFLDALDGMVARLTGQTSKSGEILDSSIDRYVEAFFIGGLMIHYREIPALQVLAFLALIGSFMVSYSSAKAEIHGLTPPKGPMRRGERAFYLTAGAILSPITIPIFEVVREYPVKIGHPMVFALALIAVMANASAVERLVIIARQVEEKEKAKRKAEAQQAAHVLDEDVPGVRNPAKTR